MELICQIIILFFGTLTIFLLAQKNKWQRWGYITGLIQEPFWVITSTVNKQWGIFVLAIVYSLCFMLGIYNHWMKK